MASTGSVQDVNRSSAQALQALFNSMSPEGSGADARKMTQEQVIKISEKLGELLGDPDTDVDSEQRNEKGELVNEDGLPIVDIREPVSDALSAEPTPVTENLFDDPDLLPPWALSDAEKARRRAQRERVLDLLEKEERVRLEKDDAEEQEHFQIELEKRKEAAKAEIENLKKARELQKKMGKALLRNVVETKEREEKERAAQEKEEQDAREARQSLKPKKSVTFADLPEDAKASQEVEARSAWGSVALGRLEHKGKSPIMTKAEMDKQPMRMHVVERHPGKQTTPLPDDQDSDDESVPDSLVHVDSDEGEVIHSDRSDDEDDGGTHSHSESEVDAELDADDEPATWDEEGFDFAAHQREIALAYYGRRATIASGVASAMRAHTHEEGEGEWDQPEVPLDASLASKPPKPSTSRFKREHSARAPRSSLPSHSLGPSIIPSSQSASLKSAIRMGKLENGTLVGGDDGDSGDDVEVEAREIFEMLRRGQFTNTGPSSAGSSTFPPMAQSPSPKTAATEISLSGPSDRVAPSQSRPSKVSKFKLALSGTNEQQGESPLSSPSLPTPSSTATRSSPKLPSRSVTPISTLSSSRSQVRIAVPAVECGRSVAAAAGQMPGMIVASPSFAPGPGGSPFFSAIIEPGSFAAPGVKSSAVNASLLRSNAASATPSPSNLSSPSTPQPLISIVVERPRGVTDAQVGESGGAPPREEAQKGGRKVSRFLAERG